MHLHNVSDTYKDLSCQSWRSSHSGVIHPRALKSTPYADSRNAIQMQIFCCVTACAEAVTVIAADKLQTRECREEKYQGSAGGASPCG